MSYILEAIKKAERERGGSLLPNAPVNEELQEEASSKRISWVAIAIFLNATILLAWLVIQQINNSDNEKLISSEVSAADEAMISIDSADNNHVDEINHQSIVDEHQAVNSEEKSMPEFLEASDADNEIERDKVSVSESTEQPQIKNDVPSFFASPDEDSSSANENEQQQMDVADESYPSEEMAKSDVSHANEKPNEAALEEVDNEFTPPVALIEPLPIKEKDIESEIIADDEHEIEEYQEPVAIALVENQNVPELGELPFPLQQEIPKIQISVHVYNLEKAARKVRINGGLFLEGQSVETGLAIEEITAHGVIFDYEGTLFKISLR